MLQLQFNWPVQGSDEVYELDHPDSSLFASALLLHTAQCSPGCSLLRFITDTVLLAGFHHCCVTTLLCCMLLVKESQHRR